MVRAVFLLLVFANLVAFVWAAGYLGGGGEGREPERLQQQLQPERLKVSLGGTPLREPGVAQICRRAGPLGSAEAEALDQALVAAGGSAQRVSIDEISYWVFIAAVDGKPAENDITALRKAGFKEFFVVSEEGPNLNAISLGVFAREDAAREKLARLVRNGIKSAKIATRAKPTGQMTLVARGTSAILDKTLAGLPTEPADCPKE